MNIDQEYLANIFEGDQLFVFNEEKSDYTTVKHNLSNSAFEEPQLEINSPAPAEGLRTKEVVILIAEDLQEKEKETLNKLLKAINTEEGQYEIIHDHPEKINSLQDLKLFLSFHNQFVQSSEYQILKINKANAIYAHELVELNQDPSKKLALWNLLKSIV